MFVCDIVWYSKSIFQWDNQNIVIKRQWLPIRDGQLHVKTSHSYQQDTDYNILARCN